MLAILTSRAALPFAGGLLLGWLIFMPLGHWRGWSQGEAAGRAAIQSEITSKALAAEKERVSDDAALSKLSDHDLCVRSLRAGGMPIDLCADL